MDFTLNQTWPTFYDYISMYKISIQYTNPFKRYRTETKSVTYRTDGTGRTDRTDGTDIRTDSGETICSPIENSGAIKKSTSTCCKYSRPLHHPINYHPHSDSRDTTLCPHLSFSEMIQATSSRKVLSNMR